MAHRLTRPPAWFRSVAILLLLWGLAGCYTCVQQFRLGAEAIGPASDYDRALYASLPIWYNHSTRSRSAAGCSLRSPCWRDRCWRSRSRACRSPAC